MKRLYKDRFDKKIGGVCGGIAQYIQVDSSIVRLVWILLSLLTGGIFVFIYALLFLILPLGPVSYIESPYKKLYRSRRDCKIAGVCGGIGTYVGIDSNIIRIAFVIFLFITGFFPVFIAYIIAAAIIPESYQ